MSLKSHEVGITLVIMLFLSILVIPMLSHTGMEVKNKSNINIFKVKDVFSVVLTFFFIVAVIMAFIYENYFNNLISKSMDSTNINNSNPENKNEFSLEHYHKLYNYLIDHINMGYDINMLRDHLIKHGWNQHLVDYVISYIKSYKK